MSRIFKNISVVLQVAGCYIIIVFGQAMWKLGVAKVGTQGKSFWEFIPNYLLSKYFLIGVFAYLLATGIWIYLLSKYDFSLIYPMNIIGLVFAIFLSAYLFNETIPLNRFIGIAIIIVGIIIISLK